MRQQRLIKSEIPPELKVKGDVGTSPADRVELLERTLRILEAKHGKNHYEVRAWVERFRALLPQTPF